MRAMKQEIPTPASIRKAYVEEYLKRRPDAEEFARFTESELADFIRKHESPNFESIYTQLDHNFYDRVRHDMAIDGLMRTFFTSKNMVRVPGIKSIPQSHQNKDCHRGFAI